MRVVAMFCGLVAGLAAVMLPVVLGDDLMQLFVTRWTPSVTQQLLGAVAWFAPATLAVLGAVLALIAPSLGALLLAASAIGWAAIGLTEPALFRLELIAPAIAAGVGACLAFLAGELELRQRRMARRQRRSAIAEEELDEARGTDEQREIALSEDPVSLASEEPRRRPERHIPLTLDDLTAAPRRSKPRQQASAWPDLPVADRHEAGRSPTSERPARPSRDLHRESARPPSTLGWLLAGNVVLLLGLVAAVAYLATGGLRPAANVSADPAAATDLAAAQEEPATVRAPIMNLPATPTSPSDELVLPMAPPNQTTPEVAVATAPAAGGLDDPFRYCSAVGTIDYIDSRYSGPALTADIAGNLGIPLNSSPDRVRWRCVDGSVLACAAFAWPVCAMTPTADEMLAYCRQNPNTPRLIAPNGVWSCAEGRPKLPDDASWPVDARGFFPNAWKVISPPVPRVRPD